MAILPLSDSVQSKLTPLSFNDFYDSLTGIVDVEIVTDDKQLADADAGKFLVVNSASSVTITLPDSLESTVCVQAVKKGTGTFTISVSGSATSNGATDDISITTRYSQVYFVHVGSGEWYVSGKDI